MNFTQAIKHITDQKRKDRALHWMKLWIESLSAAYKKHTQIDEWFYRTKNDLPDYCAEITRRDFAEWKKKEISRLAKASGKHRKPRA